MSNPATFMSQYANNIVQLVQLLQTLSTQNDQIASDSTLITRYFQLAGARTDIVAADVTNAESAITQVLFTFNSGSPTQKSFLYKMMP